MHTHRKWRQMSQHFSTSFRPRSSMERARAVVSRRLQVRVLPGSHQFVGTEARSPGAHLQGSPPGFNSPRLHFRIVRAFGCKVKDSFAFWRAKIAQLAPNRPDQRGPNRLGETSFRTLALPLTRVGEHGGRMRRSGRGPGSSQAPGPRRFYAQPTPPPTP